MKELRSEDLKEKFDCSPMQESEGDKKFKGIATLKNASAEHISFLSNEKYLDAAKATEAGAVLCTKILSSTLEKHIPQERLFICKHPYSSFAKIAQYFYEANHGAFGISDLASIAVSAEVDPSATVFPFAFIGANAKIGKNTVIYSNAFIGMGSSLGDNCIIYPNAVIREGCTLGSHCIINPGAVVGGDGFGFAPSLEGNIKIPQVGGVKIGDNVEIGSNASIDRGTIDATEIASNTKIDSIVQIGHNVRIGEGCFIAGQVGVAGSAEIGNWVMIGGQTGIVGHIKIHDNVMIGSKSSVTKSVQSGSCVIGIPAQDHRNEFKEKAMLKRILKKSFNKES